MEQNFEIKNNILTIKINKNIYPKEVIIQTTYVLLDDFYFLIDEEDKYYIITIKYKEENSNTKENLKKAAYKFFDELIESQSYIDQLKRTSKIREIILEKALLGHTLDEEAIKKLKKMQK